MSIFSGLFKSRDKPADGGRPQDHIGGLRFGFGNSAAGKVVTERTALQTTAVYACIRILSEAIGSLPLHVYKYTGDAGNPGGGGKVQVPAHPLYRLLHDEPNAEMTSFIFRETAMSHLLLYGNSYSQIVRDGRGYPIALYPLPPSRVTVDRSEGGELLYTFYDDKGKEHKLRRHDILHISGLGYDGIVGYSPIALAKQAIGTAIAVEEYGAKFFSNGANPGGVLEFPGPVKDVQRVKDNWNAGYGGASNAHKVALLEEGAKFNPISIPPEQAQFLETRKFSITEIARLYRVPPHMLADLEKATFSNIEHQSLEFVKFSLQPWVSRWEQSLFQSLVIPSEKQLLTVKFNLDGLLRGDYESRMKGYATARQNGWLSANDIRDLEELNRIPAEEGGDLYLINGSMTKLKDAGLFASGKNQTGTEEQSNGTNTKSS